jgi:GxxExxY protein
VDRELGDASHGTMRNHTQNKAETKLLFEEESYIIRGACFELYKKFRNTQKEGVYQRALAVELKAKGLYVEREKQLPVYHLEEKVGIYTPDLLVNNSIIVELKAKPFLHKSDMQQFWYYLKNAEFQLGFLINFGEARGVNIIRRVHSKLPQTSA